MAKPEWGTKRACTTCGARFYDMQKTPIVCPKCGAENEKEPLKVKRGGKTARAESVKKIAAVKPEVEEDLDDDLIADDEADDGLMEDASDLGEDDEDMAEVIEHIEPGDEED